ncbi:MAG: RNA polymerase sigma factor, partial [Verrucomicrobia bacterium]|nr:RNA polymerase sigma factor [Verrucomicrobiota bacterium]
MVTDSAPCAVAPPVNLSAPSAGARRADDARWFMEQIQPHEAALRTYLRGRFSSLQDVDDLVQETYARLLRAREIGRASLTRAYLFTVARNVALDVLRHRHAVPIMALEEIDRWAVVEDQPDAAEALSHQQELDLLADAIRTLPPRCGEIVRLRRIAGLSYQDIAARLGVTESTVNAQLAIGLIRCRHYLSAHG